MTQAEGEVQLSVPVGPRDHVQGPATAPVTLLEYGDFECPFCAMAFPTVKALQRQLGRRLRFVFRHFPRPEHPHARLAAEAAEAAGARGKFWEMHDLLYEHQEALELEDLVSYAEQLGLNRSEIWAELSSRAHYNRVQQDVLSAIHSGAHATPTFFVNGVRHEGAWQYDDLVAAIQEAERRALPRAAVPAPDVAADEVDEASWESFPASDPPGWRDHR
jgi:protein-disulfide isomerase